MLELKNISKVFNEGTVNENRAIIDINLKVDEGDFITIIGSNGAGKSTLFNLISGSYGPTEGNIKIHNKDVTDAPEYKRAEHIGRIFQNTMLGTASNMTLEDNMMICSKKGFKGLKISLNKTKRDFFKTKLKDLDMGLEERLRDNVGLLSGGQRQALTLLMMVLSEPDLVLLDEHTAALDPKNADLVLGLTVKFVQDFKLTTMMITHNMEHALKYGNRLLMMDRGEIILDVKGEEKKNLTINGLIERFHNIRKRDFTNDEALLNE
ncbi:MAG: ATP-binding cassette domain-containing protein [Spirochaetaceae bacterium]|jgi:putative ABC transport system ATP-binding protein|nr:ATP-binding cassette domain-containing protein [Spirochaetaceae bacterium]